MQKLISYLLPTNEILWKVLLDISSGYLLLEKRNIQNAQVSFSVLELHSGKLVLENLQIWESWWVSAIWIHQKKIVFSLYQEAQSPIGKGIIVYDITQKNLLWQDLSLNFFGANRQANCIFLRKNLESLQAQAYHLETGKPLPQSPLPQDENLLGYRLASVYPPESSFYEDLQRFIAQKTQANTQFPISYAETPTHICIGYGTEFEEKFAYFLLITDIAGNIELQEPISQNQDTCFFVHQPYVVIFHSKEIYAYLLKNRTL